MRTTHERGWATSAAVLTVVLAATTVLAAAPAAGFAVAGSSTLQVAIAGGPTSGPLPLTVTLMADASGGIAPYNYTWSFDDGSPDGFGPSVTHPFTVAGSYNVTVMARDSFGEPGSANLTIRVLPAALVVSLSADPSSLAAFTATYLEANVTGGVPPYQYTWSGLPPGCTGGNFASIRCVPTHTGGFTVVVNVSDTASISATGVAGLVVTTGSCPNPCSPPSGGSGALPTWELVTFLLAAAVGGIVVGVVARPWLRRRR